MKAAANSQAALGSTASLSRNPDGPDAVGAVQFKRRFALPHQLSEHEVSSI
jgi:hypothetical protein